MLPSVGARGLLWSSQADWTKRTKASRNEPTDAEEGQRRRRPQVLFL
ncbi:MAG: hypothetical protein OXG81_03670 [Acidobacteria bacterium]|nr:hypothetical protein [Acidobacteriota bacterium]